MQTTLLRRAALLLVLTGASLCPAQTAPASTEPTATTAQTVDDSPKAALKAYNAAMRNGDVAAMVALQHTSNEDQRRVARACAQSDLEVGRLIKAAREKFGDDGARKVGKAANDESDDDIDAGEESVHGNRGGVKFAGGTEPSPLIKLNGRWLVDIAEILKQYSGTPDQLADSVIRRGSAAKVTTQELLAGQLATADAVVDALKERLKDE